MRTAIHLPAVLVLIASAALAQPTPGLPPFGSFSGGPFDTIDNANLNVHFEIPVFSRAGRGIPFSYTLTYDNSIWSPVSASGTQAWTPVTSWGWAASTQTVQPLTGYLTYQTTQQSCSTGYPSNTIYYWNAYSQFYYHDPLGSAHPIPSLAISDWNSGIPCGGGAPNTMTQTTSDGSGYSVTASCSSGTQPYLTSALNPNGTAVGSPLGLSGPASGQDSNGNQINASYSTGVTTFTDTLGTTVLTASGTNPLTLAYTNPQGTTSSYKVNYSSMTVQTNFGCSGVADFGPTAVNLITSITLPDNTQYTIAYEITPGHSPSVTGRIASINAADRRHHFVHVRQHDLRRRKLVEPDPPDAGRKLELRACRTGGATPVDHDDHRQSRRADLVELPGALRGAADGQRGKRRHPDRERLL